MPWPACITFCIVSNFFHPSPSMVSPTGWSQACIIHGAKITSKWTSCMVKSYISALQPVRDDGAMWPLRTLAMHFCGSILQIFPQECFFCAKLSHGWSLGPADSYRPLQQPAKSWASILKVLCCQPECSCGFVQAGIADSLLKQLWPTAACPTHTGYICKGPSTCQSSDGCHCNDYCCSGQC